MVVGAYGVNPQECLSRLPVEVLEQKRLIVDSGGRSTAIISAVFTDKMTYRKRANINKMIGENQSLGLLNEPVQQIELTGSFETNDSEAIQYVILLTDIKVTVNLGGGFLCRATPMRIINAETGSHIVR
jgi:hypothetical protein